METEQTKGTKKSHLTSGKQKETLTKNLHLVTIEMRKITDKKIR